MPSDHDPAPPRRRRLARAFGLIASERPDRRTVLVTLVAGSLYGLMAATIFRLHDSSSLLVGVWPPNALAAALLLRARLNQEWLLLAAVGLASMAAQLSSDFAPGASFLLSAANVAEILLVVALTRHFCGPVPDMKRFGDLSRFLWIGGLIAPAASTVIASLAFTGDLAAIRLAAVTWLITSSMAMILVVPTALLLFDPVRRRDAFSLARAAEMAGLLAAGMVCTLLVFGQTDLPLLFIIPPVTLLHACRLGSLGTALFSLAVAAIATFMTVLGYGPIAKAASAGMLQLVLLQLFVASNFLTGLPFAAILASRASANKRLADGQRQLAILADHIGDAVLHYDLDRICTYASPSVRDVLGAPPECFVGEHVAARLHPEAQPSVSAAIDRLFSGQSEHERLTYRRSTDDAAGRPVYLEGDCRIVRGPDGTGPNGMVAAVRDVTRRIELEALLTHAREQAEQVAQLKSDFLANMSHEIRTPMNGVLGFAEIILQGELQPDQRRHAELIVQSGRSMMMLLNDILDLSKIEAGQFTVDHGPVDLHATLAECAALHRPDAQKKQVELIFDCSCEASLSGEHDDGARQWIITDGLRLRQIVLNLLGNAVKFTEAGSIRLAYHVDADGISITVSDTGIGIESHRMEAIFTPFNQSEGEIARRFGGTGLGLSISRKLADLLGGAITVDSTPAVGSCFTLTLPAQLVPSPRPAEPKAELIQPVELPLSAKILLAEDHDVNRLLMCEMLERCGQTVATAYDGPEAISMVIDSIMRGRPYDLVLMDVQMPGCDGYAATRAIRAEGIDADLLPIIALTANAFPGDIAAARAAGMQAHLAKPVMMADLARTLQRWLPSRIIDTPQRGHGLGQHCAPAAVIAEELPAISLRTKEQWTASRSKTLQAILEALHSSHGLRADPAAARGGRLAMMIHNLAGTAAFFGEAELGLRAAALEEALRTGASAEVCESLAHDLVILLGDHSGTAISEGARPAR
ncbi:MAG: ATP-binding protein [Erythrobacter sp.]